MSAETWAPIPGAEGYEASDQGRVRSLRTWRGQPGPRLLSLVRSNRGPARVYRVVRIKCDGRWRVRLVHQLVVEAHIGSRPEWATDVRHLNGDGLDNRLSNLAYGTASENVSDRVAHGTHHYARRTRCSRGHEYTAENTAYRESDGKTSRVCRACARVRAA